MSHSAWAEVGHNIIYKKFTGNPSEDESRILDCLNGLVATGELLLDQFHNIHVSRVASMNEPFATKYSLGDFLHNTIGPSTITGRGLNLGSMNGLLEVIRLEALKQKKLDTPTALREVVEDLDLGAKPGTGFARAAQKYELMEEELSVSVYILDHIVFQRFQASVSQEDIHDPYNSFLTRFKLIASTILWLDELFTPFSRLGTRACGERIAN